MAHFQQPARSQQIEWHGSLDDLLPPDHLARFIWNELEGLDFREIEAHYPSVRGGPGRSPYHPRLVIALWLYGMCEGMETAAAIAEACSLRVDFKWLVGGLHPCDQTLLNFLKRAQDTIVSIWLQVLRAMDQAGLIALELIVEDGTKLRVDASPRSFRTMERITGIIEQLRARLAERLAQIAAHPENVDRSALVRLSALRGQLVRAERAGTELRDRAKALTPPSETPENTTEPPAALRTSPHFGPDDFRPHPEHDAMLCPADQELRFIGEYPTRGGPQTYRLYGRSDCTGCPFKERCTQAKGRRLKMIPKKQALNDIQEKAAEALNTRGATSKEPDPEEPREPTASLTEPEARWMKATSRKRWEPCFNADICVTAEGVIVSQFLTQDNTDYHHFEPALRFVRTALGTPARWVGDGHYGTADNLQTAHRHGVLLYAPRRGIETGAVSSPMPAETKRESDVDSATPSVEAIANSRLLRGRDFQHDPEQDVLTCPAGETLRFIGEYPNDTGRGGTSRLYGRADCGGCSLKERCTRGQGRRVRRSVRGASRSPPLPLAGSEAPALSDPSVHQPPAAELSLLIEDLQKRMQIEGNDLMRLRGQTIEPTNAHLKQHGLGRFHVHGLARCAIVLTLACLAHNMMKWAARQTTLKLGLG
jgi:transposase